MKHLVYVFALALAFLFVACGDDESSFAPRDDESSGSIEEESSSSSVTLSGASAESNGSSSSSAKSSSSNGLSSSDESKMPCDVEGQIWNAAELGYYICKDGFLEPYTRPSSSSQAIPTFKESFEVDSVFASVDKEKEYGLFTDPRDGQVYKTVVVKTSYVSVPEFEVFVQNLNYGTQIKLETTEFDDNKVEKYCYDDDPWYCDTYFGGLYSWSEAMGFPKACDSVLTGSTPDCPEPLATGLESQHDSLIIIHQGICPDGWHVMNEREWRAMIAGEETCTDVVSKAFRGINATGFSALYGGCYDLQSNAYASIETWGYFWTPREFSETVGGGERLDAYHYEYIHGLMFLKGNAVSVRCVKDY